MDQSVSSSLFENEDVIELPLPLLPSLSAYEEPSQKCVRCHLSDHFMPIFPSRAEPSSVCSRPSERKQKRDSYLPTTIVPRNLFDRHFCLNCN
mmetsp:Transcript_2309/g.4210  ORF Transcript_2309/g.4210 Transcript_2309/m.4210 type:complete len:93 (+) Transcript_2309:411-689(+)